MKFKPLRTIEVSCPAWSDDPIIMREPRVRDYLAAAKIEDTQEKSLALLKVMVVGEDGNPIGDAVLDAPVTALATLAAQIPRLLGEDAGPLETTSGSDTDSASP